MRNRMVRINDEIMKELSEILRSGIKDPRMTAMASVVRVETTQDLKFAKAYISIMGDDEAKEKTMAAIENAKGHIRSTVAKAIDLRQTPEFTFVLDESLDHGDRINQILDDVNKEQE
ncbi:MAG: 30S ribosome-binding factor RbfA [Defluviitaleaceae bacterium]|nr:30S ribosome-binding factor RbfA [Defluviitaleaceae bacterium]